jgi:hypothetical protein
MPRWLDRPVVVDDALTVGGAVVPGESAQAAAVGAALSSGARAVDVLPPLGIRWVVVALDTAGPPVPPGLLAGAEPRFSGPSLALYDVGPADQAPWWPPGAWAVVGVDLVLLLTAGGLTAALFARRAGRLVRFPVAGQAGRPWESRK